MNLVLLAQEPLITHYGAAESTRIGAALDALITARSAAGIVSQRYDPERGLPALGVAPAALQEAALVAQLRAIDIALRERHMSLASLLIVGGPALIPFGRLLSPLADRDGPLLSDCSYALASPGVPLSAWAVGRMPDANPPWPGLLLAQLEAAYAQHHRPRPRIGDIVGFSSAQWQDVSAAALKAAPGARVLLAPPADAAMLAAILNPRLVVCNLHGVREAAAWYGQLPGRWRVCGGPPPRRCRCVTTNGLVQPGLLRWTHCPPADNGVGAAGERCDNVYLQPGVDLRRDRAPSGESDLLVAGFVAALAQPGISAGNALRSAQAHMLRNVLSTRGRLDGAETKTLLSFLLYGDPTLEV
ncbi:hypothetical protein HC891_05190 [Candidatus Gracilibacteria bacterium]|nr:hypothetical protein [Candidatus Gracilibacteria bacterium]